MFWSRPKDRFELLIVPHFDAGYNLARWLVKSEADADDVMQEAALRAHRFLDKLKNDDAKAWFLQIVRNQAYTLLSRLQTLSEPVDENFADPAPDISDALAQAVDHRELRAALESLPDGFREALVLRELEELSYKEISEVLQVPEGTVMSRLNRGRALLKQALERKEKS